jgi:hypothetical protein
MRGVLKQAAEHARDNSDELLVVLGHTDKTGASDYNQSLSERRARAVFAFLTFGTGDLRASALAEWGELRQKRPAGELPSIKDSWGTREYQHILQDLGFYPGAIDGDHGKGTDEAVKAYRCHKGLPPGTDVDDDVWKALIEDYLSRDADMIRVPKESFFANCPGDILRWLGCGENDPVDRKGTAFRPSRRVELIFVRTDKLPCEVPEPVTFKLPPPAGAGSDWCAGPRTPGPGCCLVNPLIDQKTNKPNPCPSAPDGPWCREPAEPGAITVEGSIKRELPDGSLEAASSQAFVLISPDGHFKADETSGGEAVPARTKGGSGSDKGTFKFENMPLGFYSLEVIAPVTKPVLVRLEEEPGMVVKGNSVCKPIRSDGERLDVVIVRDPVLREIRLPVAVHLVTSLNLTDRGIRSCPDPADPTKGISQTTARTQASVRSFFDCANLIWRQARIRFDLVDVVEETYAHPIEDPAVRGSCEVNGDEFKFVLSRCAYEGCVNVFFFKEIAGASNEGGLGISVENGAAGGIPGGVAVADQIKDSSLGAPITVTFDKDVSCHVLAHELGHYLNLADLGDLPANRDRLMLSKTPVLTTGAFVPTKQLLAADEVNRSRASRGSADDCVPLSLQVSGATQVGGSLSHHFIVIQGSGATVTVEAGIPDALLDPARGSLAMTGGSPGASDRQRTVVTGTKGDVEIVATYTPVSGSPVVKKVHIMVASFALRVEGAKETCPGSSGAFVANFDPTGIITVIAEIDPAPFCVPSTLVAWSGGTRLPDPMRRAVSRAKIEKTDLKATVAGTTRTVTILVIGDPSLPGPFAVGEHEYTEPDLFKIPKIEEIVGTESAFDMGVPQGFSFSHDSFKVSLRALVRYPADISGKDKPVSSKQPTYPLIAIAHGNHRPLYPSGTRVESFRGLEYLARHLASHGYIVISIDLDDMNINLATGSKLNRDPAIIQRGLVILEHITAMEKRNTSGPLFTGKVDMNNIGLIGHSRGGEAVVSAQKTNVDDSRGRKIKGIVSISPTDFLGITHTSTPYLVIYGSADGDVSPGWPFYLYDRAAPPKAMIFVYGAIHNRFSTDKDWLGKVQCPPFCLDSADSRRLGEDEHKNIAKGYCLAFFENFMRKQIGFETFFMCYDRPPSVAAVELLHQYQDSNRLVIDDFEQGVLDRTKAIPPQLADRAKKNTLAGNVAVSGLSLPEDISDASTQASLPLSDALTEASLRRRDMKQSWHETIGALVAWDSVGGAYTTQLGGLDVSPFPVLSFRVAQRFGSVRNPSPAGVAPGADKDFFVRLVDSTGRVAEVRVGTITDIPFPYKRSDDTNLTKSALKTIRIPLSAFVSHNSLFDTHAVSSIVFLFGLSARGEIAIDDIEFSN